MDIINFDDLFQVARNEALIRQGALTVASVDRQGSDANILFAAAAAVGDKCIGQLVLVEAGQFLDTAQGAALDRWVFDRYSLVRKQAAPAVGSVTFVLPALNASPFTIPVGTLVQTSGGVLYAVTAAALFPAGVKSVADVPVQSVLAGTSQQAGIGQITGIASAIRGAPNGLTVINPVATAGAADAESDSSLRARARKFFSTARRGTLAAIEAGALAVAGVQTARAFEALNADGRPGRSVELIITDQYTSGLASLATTPATYQTQSQALSTTVFNALDDVRAGGINVVVIVAQVAMQPFTTAPNITAGADAGTVVGLLVAAIVNYTNGLSSGETWSMAAMVQLLKGIPGLANPSSCIISPPNDVVPPGSLVVIRTDTALVTVI